jgi:replicative DNA helicase Mcm
MLFYPKEFLFSFLRGLYDSDGWISVREKGSSQIGISSTSEDLIEFVRLALSILGITGYSRQRNPKTTIKRSGTQIVGRKRKHELVFSTYSDFLLFKQHIGFSHPKKQRLLDDFCTRTKQYHRNSDTIPLSPTILKDLIYFYGYQSRDFFGRKGALAPSNLRKTISRDRLSMVLKKIKPDWKNHRIRIPYEYRNEFYLELRLHFSLNSIAAYSNLTKEQINEYLVRKGRNPSIPIGAIYTLFQKTQQHLSHNTRLYWMKIFKDVQSKDEEHLARYKLLVALNNSDIHWDEVSAVKKISSKDQFVYDLTIPETHNFIVNGFVTHNTAAVIRDQDTGEITLEAGALVLADRGIAMVDEFDKMRADDRVAIHEAMEQHSISIAKAGIVATLNARTAILAAANPRRGRWNPYKPTADNLNLPPTILSRFDLIFVMEDKPDLKEDRDKATHILNLHKSKLLSREPPIDQPLLRKYIAYARREIRPTLSDEAQERLLEYYMTLRKESEPIDEKGVPPIAITPRQLEALVRLSEARAKMRLSDIVSYDDASGAINLMKSSLEKLARDTETGKLDIDRYASDTSARSRRMLDRIEALIDRKVEDAKAKDAEPAAINDILDQAFEEGLDRAQIRKVIDELIRRGHLFEPRPGHIDKP